MTSCPVIALAKALIRKPSISPDDAGCHELIINHLQKLGFIIEEINFTDTKNLWAYHKGNTEGKTLAFAGHSDVVPAGDETQWLYPPFDPRIHDGMLYGRGTADMKGSLAAMLIAAEKFIQLNPQHSGRLAFIITSDEEASAINGTVKVVEALMVRNEAIDYCLVGEPSSIQFLGDVIKIGRRGSITANLTIHGQQGHVAYPHLAKNPIHDAAPFLNALINECWDNGNSYFPSTSMQIANIHAGTGSNNVIPGNLFIQFNFRFSSELTPEQIKMRTTELLEKFQLSYSIEWSLSGMPFLTKHGDFVETIIGVVQEQTGLTPKLQTDGGTSDGRFIAKMGTQVVELGPINSTIHKVNEHIKIEDLQQLSEIYQKIMQRILV